MNESAWSGKRALITGGTSGLGEALARLLSAQGAKVAVVARGQHGLERVGREIPGVFGIRADVSKPDDTPRIVAEVHAALGGVDVLFNNASYLGETPLRLLADTESGDFERVLQTNLLGAFRLTKAVLPDMLLRGEGLVVDITSDAAVNAYPGWGAYGASKAALSHMNRIFGAELEPHGLRFVAIDPGDMRTAMHFAAVPDADPSALLDPRDAAVRILDALTQVKEMETV